MPTKAADLAVLLGAGAPSIVLTPSTAPTATEGTTYYDSSADSLKVYNGTAWADVSPSGMNTVYTASNITMVAGTASPALVLNSGSGVGVTLSSSDSDVLIVAHGNVAKTSGSTNSAYNMDILVSGGNLGTGLEDDGDPEGDTDDANTKVVADITDGIGYGVYVPFFFIAYDTAPGSTTPTYNFIRNGTPSIVYTFQYVGVTIFEVFT